MRSSLLVLVPSVLVAACGGDEPPTPSEVRTHITDDLGHVVREATAAAELGDDALAGGASLGLLAQLATAGGARDAALPRLFDGLVGPRGDSRDPGARRSALLGDADDPAAALTRRLDDELFTDANHLGDGVYRIPAELLCSTDPVLDAACADHVAAAELRVRVTRDGDALGFDLEIGPDHEAPLHATLAHDALAVTLDLDAAGRVVPQLAAVFGDEPPALALAGAVTGRVDILGTASARFALAFDRAIAIASDDAFRFTSARADVASITLDAPTRSAAFALGLGATTLHVADDRTFDLALPGLTAIGMMIPNQPIQLTHVGLGDASTTLEVDGARALTVDLNPDDGRAFDATLGGDALAVSPRLDLRLAVDHGVLGDDPVYDVTRLDLAGGVRGVGDALEVTSGSLALTTDPAAFGFTATAGQCVRATVVEDAATGRAYDQWRAGSCE